MKLSEIKPIGNHIVHLPAIENNKSNQTYYNYKDKAFFLSDDYNWEIKTDSDGTLCLIPTKK